MPVHPSILRHAIELAVSQLLACAALIASVLCALPAHAQAQALHPKLISGKEILFDAVPLTETVEKSEVDFVVLIPKGRCTPTPQRVAWLGLALEPRPVGVATALLACQLMSRARWPTLPGGRQASGCRPVSLFRYQYARQMS